MTPELHQAIGQVAVAYSSLDFMIVSFAGRLISPDQRIGQTIFGPMQMSRKIDLLRTLFKMLPSVGCDDSPRALASLAEWDVEPVLAERVAELDRLLNRAKAAGETRNNIMHALTWFPDDRQPGGPIPTILKVKGSGLSAHPMPVSRVQELAAEIASVTHDLGQFMARHCRDREPQWEPLLGRGTLWESTVKMALSWFTKPPQPPKEQP